MRIFLDGRACLLGALLLLTLPFPWVLAAVSAAFFHELCHLLALSLTGTAIWSVRVGISGTEIQTAPLSREKELACAAAGPVGSLLLLLLIRYIPRIALCAAVQGLFNLLPLFPLDGGRMLRSFTAMLLPERRADLFSAAVEKLVLLAICIAAFVLSFAYELGLLPILVAAMLTFKAMLRKIPCKEAKLAVQ